MDDLRPSNVVGAGSRKIRLFASGAVISAGPARDENPLPVPLRPGEGLQMGSAGKARADVLSGFNRECPL